MYFVGRSTNTPTQAHMCTHTRSENPSGEDPVCVTRLGVEDEKQQRQRSLSLNLLLLWLTDEPDSSHRRRRRRCKRRQGNPDLAVSPFLFPFLLRCLRINIWPSGKKGNRRNSYSFGHINLGDFHVWVAYRGIRNVRPLSRRRERKIPPSSQVPLGNSSQSGISLSHEVHLF